MNFSRNQYLLNSPHPANEVAEKLYANTLISEKLIRKRTNKLFIGEISEEGFYLMGSSRTGVLYTLNGKFVTDGQQTRIEIESKIHWAFIMLFACWAAMITVFPLISYIINPIGSGVSIGMLPFILAAIISARLLLHFAYTRARNNAISEIKALIA